MVTLQKVAADRIEEESFSIINDEFEDQTGLLRSNIPDREYAVMQRVIHATGDFSIAHSLRFSKHCFGNGIKAVRQGKKIFADVQMLASGISKLYAGYNKNEIVCYITDNEVIKDAKEKGKTRSEIAAVKGLAEGIGIAVVGNAPTSLIKIVELVQQEKADIDLIIGVPVGFVNAAESKELLMQSGVEYISCKGRRGGTPVAAAIMNALFRMT